DDTRALLKQGDNLLYAQEGAQPRPTQGEVQQGMLERSNASVISEMVELINNQRVYEANSKAVTTQDTMLESSVTQLGRLS
ncbi:MAG: flagellar basal-body rod protein FlgG, partial [Selenomonadaceae bacterium]|nr:flagellar basal-body rod protein FlgG [Selenomonadaceae bacterium]